MNTNENFRIFMCVDFQLFVKCITHYGFFCSTFKFALEKLNIKDGRAIFNEINNSCIDELDDISNNINLKRILFFSTCVFSENKKYFKGSELEEPQIVFARLFSFFYLKNLKRFIQKDKKISFTENILKPFNKLFELNGTKEALLTDNKNYSIIKEEYIQGQNIQNLMSSMQFHSFFEDYINNLFSEKGEIVNNPIILFNPRQETKKGKKLIIEGYFELDGSIFDDHGQITFIECKNTLEVKQNHITNFLGKVHLIEKVYNFNSKKILFSTGKRQDCFMGIEKYSKLTDFKIYCIDNFMDGYKGL